MQVEVTVLNAKGNRILKNAGFGFTAAGIAFSYAFALGACSGLNIYYALACAAVCLVLSVAQKNEIFATDSFLAVPVIYVAGVAGAEYLPVAGVTCATVFLLIKLFPKKLKVPSCIIAGAALGLAFSATALLTTYYFGIGATGSTVLEILENYRYLGFHPNWRGVFYGTITLFAMITYPFKFKRLSKYLPAEVFSVAIPFVLNLFLNPSGASTPILEVGALSNAFTLSGVKSFLPFVGIEGVSGERLFAAISGGVAAALILVAYKFSGKKDSVTAFCGNALSGLSCGFPVRGYPVKAYSAVSAAVGVATLSAAVFFGTLLFSRVPVHSLAVVLIVSAWQNVPFSLVASAFKEKGILEIFTVIAVFAGFVFLDVLSALVICLILSIVVRRVRK